MRHLPESGSGLHVNDLFLLAVITGNSHGDISLLHLYGVNRDSDFIRSMIETRRPAPLPPC